MIDKIAAKYDVPIELPGDQAEALPAPHAQPPALAAEYAPWRMFPDVVALSEHLQANKEHGIQIVRQGDMPVLHFDPPLDDSDQARMDAAQRALELFADAVGDVYYLMHRGLIPVKDHPGYV